MSNKRVILELNGSEIEVWEDQAEYIISKGWQRVGDKLEAITEEEDEDGDS